MDRAEPLCPAPDMPERFRRAVRLPPAQEVCDQVGPGPLQGPSLQHEEEIQKDRAYTDIKWQREALNLQDSPLLGLTNLVRDRVPLTQIITKQEQLHAKRRAFHRN